MKTLKALLLLAVVLSVDHSVTADPIPDHSVTAAPSPDPVTGLPPRSVGQFGSMINCEAGKYWFNIFHVANYLDYGCFCGPGGKGNPVDDLDRCCQVHDECYNDVHNNPECPDLLWEGDAPYLKSYNFSCDKGKKKAICYKVANDECQYFICECDRATAECFANTPYNDDNWNIDQSLCE